MKSNESTQKASSTRLTEDEAICNFLKEARDNPAWAIANVTLVKLISASITPKRNRYDRDFLDQYLYFALIRLSEAMCKTEGTSGNLIELPQFVKTYRWLLDRAKYPIDMLGLSDISDIVNGLTNYVDAYMGRSGPQDRRAEYTEAAAETLDTLMMDYALPWWKKFFYIATFRYESISKL